ncbi:MAG: hypothetical protein U5O39_01080 [Gammaproteobacteria bacterium]|nr:hypothetical protein [Gammaproteobacteria bacterium]
MTTLTRLDHYGFLALNGHDATKFLQGYTTCDLDDVTTDTSRIGAILQPPGTHGDELPRRANGRRIALANERRSYR